MLPKFSEKVKRIFGRVVLFEFGLVLGMVIMLFLVTINLPFSFTDAVSNMVEKGKYNTVVYSNLDDEVAIKIVNFCEPFPAANQVDCVVAQMQAIYNYNESDHTLLSPTEYKNQGGVCRDIAIFYRIIFENLGWDCQYIFPSQNHVFLTITKSKNNSLIYCNIDGKVHECLSR